MNPAQLSDMQFSVVQKVLLPHIDRFQEVKVFGSRATGKNRRGSDLDLALVGADALLRDDLLFAFDESDLSITVDIVDLDRCGNDALKDEIARDAIPLLQ